MSNQFILKYQLVKIFQIIMRKKDRLPSTDKQKRQLYDFFGIPSFNQWVNRGKKQQSSKASLQFMQVRTTESYLDSQMPVTLQQDDPLRIQTRQKFSTPEVSKNYEEEENAQRDLSSGQSNRSNRSNRLKQQSIQKQRSAEFHQPTSRINQLRQQLLQQYPLKSPIQLTLQQEHSFQQINQRYIKKQAYQYQKSPTFPQEGTMQVPQPQQIMQSKINNKSQKQSEVITPQKRQLTSRSNHQSKVSTIKKKQEKFIDISFPNNDQSLWGEYGKQNWSNVQWKKISDIYQISDIFFGVISPINLMPGLLGNCYFFSAISALAQSPNRIKKMFVTKELTSQRNIVVRIYHKGVQRHVQIDEWIPCVGSRAAFTRSKQSQLWPIFLQKAWAKLHSSYKRIQSGYPQEALHDLTGAPIKRFCFRYPSFSKDSLWQYLILASRNDYPMIASSKSGSDRNKSQSDNLYGQLFTVLSATYLNIKGQSIKVVRLRNPWIKSELNPKGAWKKTDSNWQIVNQKQRERIGYTKEKQDGIFFMNYQDFLNEFIALTVAQTIQSYQYNHLTKKDNQCKGVFYKLQILQEGYYSIQVSKTPQKCYASNSAVIRKLARKNIQFRYPVAKLQIGTYHNGILYKECPVFSSPRQRSMFVSYNLKPGNYFIQVNVKFDNTVEEQFDVTLSTYSFYKCKLIFAPFKEAVDMSSSNDVVDWQ